MEPAGGGRNGGAGEPAAAPAPPSSQRFSNRRPRPARQTRAGPSGPPLPGTGLQPGLRRCGLPPRVLALPPLWPGPQAGSHQPAAHPLPRPFFLRPFLPPERPQSRPHHVLMRSRCAGSWRGQAQGCSRPPLHPHAHLRTRAGPPTRGWSAASGGCSRPPSARRTRRGAGPRGPGRGRGTWLSGCWACPRPWPSRRRLRRQGRARQRTGGAPRGRGAGGVGARPRGSWGLGVGFTGGCGLRVCKAPQAAPRPAGSLGLGFPEPVGPQGAGQPARPLCLPLCGRSVAPGHWSPPSSPRAGGGHAR